MQKVLNILIPNEASGYKIVELGNWVGKCFIIPRTELKELKALPEANHPALYFLFGENDESTNQKLYIGESESFFDRLLSHNAGKDFWNTAIIFTGGLDKAKIKYLEFLATNEANKVNRYDLLNSASPRENILSKFDSAMTRDYFLNIDFLLTVLGYPVFQSVVGAISDLKMYFIKSEGCDAQSHLLDDGSINVLKGSLARIKETDTFTGWSLAARRKFIEDGTLKNNDDLSYIFTRDVLFKSPSAAAATITGRSINGWIAWKDKNGNTLDENLRQ